MYMYLQKVRGHLWFWKMTSRTRFKLFQHFKYESNNEFNLNLNSKHGNLKQCVILSNLYKISCVLQFKINSRTCLILLKCHFLTRHFYEMHIPGFWERPDLKPLRQPEVINIRLMTRRAAMQSDPRWSEALLSSEKWIPFGLWPYISRQTMKAQASIVQR